MSAVYIQKEARRLVRWAGTRDPFRIARELGIHVLFDYNFTALKGMYKVIQRSSFIIINGNLAERYQRMVCAHELGHDRLHRQFAKTSVLQEFMLYDMRSKPEYEANIFASELLIADEDILTLIESKQDIAQIGDALGEDLNLVLIKIDELRKQGYEIQVPYRPQADFLRHS